MKNQDLHQIISQTRAQNRDKLLFIHRYVEHLFRCYRDLGVIASHLDSIMSKLY